MLIGELASCTGTTPRALRYYEEQGLLQPHRTSVGYRHYDEDAPRQVTRIRALLAAGFSSAVVAEVLPCVVGEDDIRVDVCPRVLASMRRVLSGLDDDIERLERQRSSVSRLLGG